MSEQTRTMIKECIVSVTKEDLPNKNEYPWGSTIDWDSMLTKHNVRKICPGVDVDDVICISFEKGFNGFLFTEEGFAGCEWFMTRGRQRTHLVRYGDLAEVRLTKRSYDCYLRYLDGSAVSMRHAYARYIGIVVNRILETLYGRKIKHKEQQTEPEEKLSREDTGENRTQEEKIPRENTGENRTQEEKLPREDTGENRTPEELFLAGTAAEQGGNTREAVRLYRLAAEKGSASAAWNLSVIYAGGKGLPEDLKESFRWQLCAAQKGEANAMYAVAKNYYYGENGTDEDNEQALFWAKKAKESGQLPADTPVDDLIRNAERYVTFNAARAAYKAEDFEEAIRQYQRSAELGSSAAAWNLSRMYIRGEGTAEDLKESFRWKLRSAELGDAEAMYDAAYSYHHGSLGAEQDNEQALFWAKKAKESGKLPDAKTDKLIAEIEDEISGQHFLRGVAAYKHENYTEAFRQFLIAADEGKPGAAWNLSIMCAKGEGTAQDEQESFRWKVKEAELGDPKIMLSVAQDYHEGENGAEQNREQALFWAKKAKENTSRSKIIEQADQLIQEIETEAEKDPLDAAFDAYEAGDFEKAAQLFRIAADAGDANGAYLMAVLYTAGEGVPKDEQESFHWRMRAAQLGHADAMYFMAVSYFKGGDGVTQDLEKALFWAEKAKENGEFLEDRPVDSLIRAIRQSIEDERTSSVAEDADDTDFDEAVQKLKYLAEKGDDECAWALANLYRAGELVPEDQEESLRWQLRAAQLGNADAMYAMAVCCFNGDSVEADVKEALRWAYKAKESGALSADVPVDDLIRECEAEIAFARAQAAENAEKLEEAVWQYTMAAKRGVLAAALRLGNMYEMGEGVPKDMAKAAQWYEEAAELGSVSAQYAAGMLYNFGAYGLTCDKTKAAKWLQMAADAGHPEAQFYFGFMCLNGEGVPSDRERGKQYFIKAASQGYHEAGKLLEEQFGFTGYELLDRYFKN